MLKGGVFFFRTNVTFRGLFITGDEMKADGGDRIEQCLYMIASNLLH